MTGVRQLLWLAILGGTAPMAAQDKTKPLTGEEAVIKYLAAETERLSGKFLDGAKTLEEWQEKLPRLRREYYDMLGLWPAPAKTPLHATVTGQVEAHGVVVEKVHFQSKPGLYVTGNLYRPKNDGDAKRKRLPAVLYVCGHAGRGRDGNKSAFQDHGFWFANNGYVCLAIDTLQLGEIPGVHHGTYGRPWAHLKSYGIDDPARMKLETRWWWHSAGYSPAAVECWNGIRAIDYLLTRPDVDPERVGVTGISGGGASTVWIAAADERVKIAVPVSGMSDLESYIKNKIINGHCDCMFVNNTHQWEWTTLAALIAPRPLLFANSDNDAIFPMDGNRRIIEKLHMIYFKYGNADVLEEYVSKGGHDYRPDLRVAIFRFFNKHLKGNTTTPVEDSAKYSPLPGKELRVFATDADLPKDRINDRIDETFVPRARVTLPAPGKFAEWKQSLLAVLRRRCFRQLDHKGEPPGFTDATHLIGKGKSGPMLVLERKEFDALGDYPTFAKRFARDGTVSLLFFPEEFYAWPRKSPPNTVERSHILLGSTVDERRVAYLANTARQLANYESHPGWDGRIVGKGTGGVLGAYAALFEPAIKEVVLIDPPASHVEGPHFLGVLRVLDIPDALGLLAPRPLTIYSSDPAFDRTAELYRRAGAADKFTRK